MHYAKLGLCSVYSSKCPLTCGRCQYDPDADKWATPSRGRQVKESPVTIGAALEIEFDVKVEGTVFGWSNSTTASAPYRGGMKGNGEVGCAKARGGIRGRGGGGHCRRSSGSFGATRNLGRPRRAGY